MLELLLSYLSYILLLNVAISFKSFKNRFEPSSLGATIDINHHFGGKIRVSYLYFE